jgi:hypothetical protein
VGQTTMKRTWRWSTYLKLVLAGWKPGRNVWEQLELPESLPVFAEAQRVLAEFGQLRLGTRHDRIHLGPSVEDDIVGEIKTYERRLGRRLYPIGVMEHQDPVQLLLDDHGIVYTLMPGLELEPMASSFDRAIEFLIRRHTSRQESRDDLRRVGISEKAWRLEDRG